MSLFGKKSESHPEASPEPQHPGHRSGYGIDSAIQLMRTLPVDQNPDLVVHVIKNTLESLNVRLSDIVQEAVSKEEVIHNRVAELRNEILHLEQEIDRRHKDIALLEADLAETTKVKERLQMAEGTMKSKPTPPPAPHMGAPPIPPPPIGSQASPPPPPAMPVVPPPPLPPPPERNRNS